GPLLVRAGAGRGTDTQRRTTQGTHAAVQRPRLGAGGDRLRRGQGQAQPGAARRPPRPARAPRRRADPAAVRRPAVLAGRSVLAHRRPLHRPSAGQDPADRRHRRHPGRITQPRRGGVRTRRPGVSPRGTGRSGRRPVLRAGRPHQRPRQLPGRAFPRCTLARHQRQGGAGLQPRLQPAVRVHPVRHLPAAAAGEPAGPGHHRRREELHRQGALMRRLAVAVPRPRRFAGLAVLLLGLLLSLQALAAPPKPLLWKVSDADNAVYLLGSFHMLRPGDYPVAREVQEVLAGAGSVVFELSPDEANSPRLAATMVQAAQRKRPGTLEGDLGPRLSARLRAYADARGLPLERLSGFDPWFVGLTLSLLQLQQQGLDPALGLDRHLMDAAAAAGKPTAGLETGAAQIAALSGMPVDAQLQMLEQALDQAEAGPG